MFLSHQRPHHHAHQLVTKQGFNYTGLIYAGSSTYILIYSSVTVWVAVFSRLGLGKVQTAMQWCGCALVTVGVAVTGANAGKQGSDVAVGVLLVVLGSVGHSLAYGQCHVLLSLCTWSPIIASHQNLSHSLSSDGVEHGCGFGPDISIETR